MKKIPVILALLAVAVVAYSMSNWNSITGNSIQGSKNITTETRDLDDFNKIVVGGAFEVKVTYSSKEEVTIDAPENLHEHINLTVKSGTLHVKFKSKRGYNTESPVKIEIKTKKLNEFDVSGAASVRLKNTMSDNEFTLNSSGAASFKGELNVDEAKVEADGASGVHLSGSATTANIYLSGATSVSDFDFKVENVNIDMSGASKAKITSLNSLNGELSGASSLNYKGDPSIKKVSTSGAASIDHQ